MLNIGQVVYDVTNKRLLIYGGMSITHVKSGCETTTTFLTEDLKTLVFSPEVSGKAIPFRYTNFERGANPEEANAIPLGKFVEEECLEGIYLGCLDFNSLKTNKEAMDNIIATFKEANNWPKPKIKEYKNAAT